MTKRTTEWGTRTLVVLFVAIASVLVIDQGPASACSCVRIDVEGALASHPAALVGTVVETAERGHLAVFTLAVSQDIHGNLDDRVEVLTAGSGPSCGLEARVGSEIGLFLTDADGVWHSGLCQSVEPNRLLRAAGLTPQASDGEPTGTVATETSPLTLLMIGTLVLLAVAAVFAALRRRRRA
jgi:hypothetical protein